MRRTLTAQRSYLWTGLALRNTPSLPRSDLVLVAGNAGAQRQASTAMLPTASPPPEYAANRDLQVVELVFHHGGELIDQLYDALWSANAAT